MEQKINFKKQYRIELAETLKSHYYSVWEQGKKKEKFLGHFMSVTTYLQAYPTSEQLIRWIAEKGFHESREIRDAAGFKGSRIHSAIEVLLEDKILQKSFYTTEEWVKLKSFVNWYHSCNPEIIATEMAVFSRKGKYAGRVDCIAKIDDEIAVVDWKSSRSIHPSFNLQFAAYANAVEEMTDLKINYTAAVQLGAQNKNGYRFVVDDDWREHYKVFKNVKATWEYDNKKQAKQPPVLELPATLKL